MTQVSEKKPDSNSILIHLPQSRYGLLDHLANIRYAIRELQKYLKNNGSNLVIGYYVLRSGLGDTETLHQILPKKELDLKNKNLHFAYHTIEELLEEEAAYKSGKYKVRDEHFVGLNPIYPG